MFLFFVNFFNLFKAMFALGNVFARQMLCALQFTLRFINRFSILDQVPCLFLLSRSQTFPSSKCICSFLGFLDGQVSYTPISIFYQGQFAFRISRSLTQLDRFLTSLTRRPPICNNQCKLQCFAHHTIRGRSLYDPNQNRRWYRVRKLLGFF